MEQDALLRHMMCLYPDWEKMSPSARRCAEDAEGTVYASFQDPLPQGWVEKEVNRYLNIFHRSKFYPRRGYMDQLMDRLSPLVKPFLPAPPTDQYPFWQANDDDRLLWDLHCAFQGRGDMRAGRLIDVIRGEEESDTTYEEAIDVAQNKIDAPRHSNNHLTEAIVELGTYMKSLLEKMHPLREAVEDSYRHYRKYSLRFDSNIEDAVRRFRVSLTYDVVYFYNLM